MKKIFKFIIWLGLFPFMLAYWGWRNQKKPAMWIGIVLSAFFLFAGAMGDSSEPIDAPVVAEAASVEDVEEDASESADLAVVDTDDKKTTEMNTLEEASNDNEQESPELEQIESSSENATDNEAPALESTVEPTSLFEGYTLLKVDGGALSGNRKPNVVVDIGFGSREYWAFTNEHGQLVRVMADEIIPQDENTETVLSSGRYYPDEAKVPGTEAFGLDEGHVIADSLGGVANAYNITPQDSTLNRHGDQAYMEKVIRDAGGCTNFEAIITYPDTETQIPSHYEFTYTLMGNVIVDSFDNVDPDVVNESLGEFNEPTTDETPVVAAPVPVIETPVSESPVVEQPVTQTPAIVSPPSEEHSLASVDSNGNGKVTISEAKAAGFRMPITSDHWLYQYMDDRDGDGMVGE